MTDQMVFRLDLVRVTEGEPYYVLRDNTAVAPILIPDWFIELAKEETKGKDSK